MAVTERRAVLTIWSEFSSTRFCMRVQLHRALQVALLCACFTSAACSPQKETPVTERLQVEAFSATPSLVAVGRDVTLNWSVSGPLKELRLLRHQELLTTSTEPQGTFTVPAVTEGETVFTLTAQSSLPGNVEVSADVTVRSVSSATIASFTVDRSAVRAGASAVLSWETVAATRVTISAGTKEIAQFSDADAEHGSLLIRPTGVTKYTLTAFSASGTDIRTLSVSILAEPEIRTARAEPMVVKSGNVVTLSWETVHTDSLTVSANGRLAFQVSGDEANAGSRELGELLVDTSFVFLAEGPGGQATSTVNVAVISNPRILSFEALPSDVVMGSSVLLQWSTEDVDTCHLDANGSSVDPSAAGVPVDGTFAATPNETTTYHLACTGPGGAIAADLPVNVYGVPQIISFAADQTSIFRRQPATLSWTVKDATSISIADIQGNVVDLGLSSPSSGSVTVYPLRTTNYTLTAVGPAGLVRSVPIQIQVQDPPPAIQLTIGKGTILEGTSTELSWNVLDVSSLSLTATGADGVPKSVDVRERKMVDLISVSPSETTVYTLTANGVGGYATESISLTVIHPPRFEYVNADKLVVTRGLPFNLSWKATDTTYVTAVNPQYVEGTSAPYTTIEELPGTNALTPALGTTSMSTLIFPDNFTFPFYGKRYPLAYVAAAGYVCFDSTQCSTTVSSSANKTIPFGPTQPNLFIAPFWDALTIIGDSATAPRSNFLWRVDGTAPTRTLTIEWRHMEYVGSTSRTLDLNFKVVLSENGSIALWNAPRTLFPSNASDGGLWGTSASIGYEGPDGADGWQAQPANDPTASALCRTFVPGKLSPLTNGQCDPLTNVRSKPFPAIGSATITAETGTAALMNVKLRAYGPLGSSDSTPLIITLVDAPAATSLVAGTPYVGAGEPVELTWTAGPNKAALKAIAIVDDQNNTLYSLNAPQIASFNGAISGKITVRPSATTTYSLVVTNLADDRATTSATVKVDRPTATFAVDSAYGPSGEVHTFTWTSTAAQQLTVFNPDGTPSNGAGVTFPLTMPVDRTRIQSGALPMIVTQSGDYVLHVENGSGSTDIPVTVTLTPTLQIVTYSSNISEQTAGKTVTLSWQLFNSTDMKIEIIPPSQGTPTVVLPLGGASVGQRRNGFIQTTVQDYNTVFRLTAVQDLGGDNVAQVTQDVVVTAVPIPIATSFTATPGTVNWNVEPVTISWTTQGAATLRLYEMATTADGAPNGPEIAAARDQLNGSISRTLIRATRYRLVLTNRLGEVRTFDMPTAVNVTASGPPSISLNIPQTAVPDTGFVDLSWTATNVEKVYLWRRSPGDASGATTGTPIASSPDAVQTPYTFVPFGFIDISSTGTPIPLKSAGVVNYDTGYALMDLPLGFTPDFFGEIESRILISADGVILLAPAGTPDTSTLFACNGVTVGDCRTPSASLQNVDTTTAIAMRHLVAPFWMDLTAKSGCAGISSDPSSCSIGRQPGQVFTQLLGQAPNRVYVVQWDNWDAKAPYAGSLTFQAKLYENGDVEYQYKKMQSYSVSNFARGGSATVGVDHKFKSGPNYRNYWLQLPASTTSFNVKSFISEGDGWHIYAGAQPISGSIRTSINTVRAYTTTPPTPNSVMFRATGYVTGLPNPPVASQLLMVTPGTNEVVITEMMVDPVAGSDAGRQWIELRNLTASAVPLGGYSLQTSNGTYTFDATGIIPASGYILVGQANADLPLAGGVIAVSRNWPQTGTGLMLSPSTDVVVLRSNQVVVDRVEYDFNAGWKSITGNSISLDSAAQTASVNTAALNDDSAYWCGAMPATTTNFMPGPPSTPGTPNGPCRYFDQTTFDPTYNLAQGSTASLPFGASTTNSADRVTSTPVDIGFKFPYFSNEYSSVYISDNGCFSFGATTGSTSVNATLPNTSAAGVDGVYPFWDDLMGGIPGRGFVRTKTIGTAPNRTFIMHWDGYTFSYNPPGGELSFQAVLKEGGGIEFHYDTMNQNGTTTQHLGSSATIGLEALNDTYAVLYSFGTVATATTWTPPMVQLPTPKAFALKLFKAP